MPNPHFTFENDNERPTPAPLLDSRLTAPRFSIQDLYGFALPVRVQRSLTTQTAPDGTLQRTDAAAWVYQISLQDEGLGSLLMRTGMVCQIVPDGYQLRGKLAHGLVLYGTLALAASNWTTRNARDGMLTLRAAQLV